MCSYSAIVSMVIKTQSTVLVKGLKHRYWIGLDFGLFQTKTNPASNTEYVLMQDGYCKVTIMRPEVLLNKQHCDLMQLGWMPVFFD